MQQASDEGIRPAPEAARRCTVRNIHNAPIAFKDSLIEMWSAKSPQEAYDVLSQPDVTVTNQSDKEAQLPKIISINKLVKDTLVAYEQ